MKPTFVDRLRASDGFTLIETLVSVLVVSLIMGAAFVAVTHAVRLSETARLSSGVNSNLRGAMDVIVRDLSQAGQGLPGTAHRVTVPNNSGSTTATAINNPVAVRVAAGAATTPTSFTTYPIQVSLPAINTGYYDGYSNQSPGRYSDAITVIYADPKFQGISVSAATGGTTSVSVTVTAAGLPNGAAVTTAGGGAKNINLGDLIDIVNGNEDTLMAVTGISGQTLTFANANATYDPLGLNQNGLNRAGTGTDVLGTTTVADVTGIRLSRVRIISYYLSNDVPGDPRYPRLVRRINGDPPQTVAWGIENFNITYDLSSPSTNYVGVSMTDNDVVTGDGACKNGGTNQVCSPDWVRKINVVLGARSLDQTQQKKYISNTVFSQIAVRSLAFQDRFQ